MTIKALADNVTALYASGHAQALDQPLLQALIDLGDQSEEIAKLDEFARAIKALISGTWDDPALLNVGPLHIGFKEQVKQVIEGYGL